MTASPRHSQAILFVLLLVIVPVLSGCSLFTVPDTAPPCPPGSTVPTPGPTPTSQSGTVRFGTIINPNLTVHHPRTTFGIHEMLAWIAHFSHPIKSGLLHFELFRNECGRWVRVYKAANIAYAPNQRWTTRGIVPALRLEFRIIQLGTYQVRYLNRGSVVAQGEFVFH
jgi:hypothetical protein